MHIPERTCIVCRKKDDKCEFIRIVKSKNGEINIDALGKTEGRGAYICKDKACFDRLVKSKALNRTFHQEVRTDIYERILNEINKI